MAVVAVVVVVVVVVVLAVVVVSSSRSPPPLLVFVCSRSFSTLFLCFVCGCCFYGCVHVL